MRDLTRADNHWDPKLRQCKAIIETRKGSRNKFDYEPEYDLFGLGGLLPEGMHFPYDFGFIPSTLGEDGDPLDVVVFMDDRAHVGCVLDIRLIGVIEAEQTEDGKTVQNDRLFATAIHSYNHEDLKSISELPKSVVEQVQQFFVNYNQLRGKKFKPTGTHGPKRAAEVVEAGIKAFKKKPK